MPLQSIETTSTTSTFSSPGHPSPQEFQKQLHGQSSLNSEVGPSARRPVGGPGKGPGEATDAQDAQDSHGRSKRSHLGWEATCFFLVHMNDRWSMDRWLETSWDPLKLMPATLPPWLSLADRQMWRASEGPIVVVEGVSIQGPSDLGASVSVSQFHVFGAAKPMFTLAKDGWGNPVYPLMFRGNLGTWKGPKGHHSIILKVPQVLVPRNWDCCMRSLRPRIGAIKGVGTEFRIADSHWAEGNLRCSAGISEEHIFWWILQGRWACTC